MSKQTKKTDPLKGDRGFNPRQHQNSWQTAWENLKKAAGLQGFRFHDLRHTHITHTIEAGVPIEVVMAQVGHLSAEMTRYYTHLNRRETGCCEGGSRERLGGHGSLRIASRVMSRRIAAPRSLPRGLFLAACSKSHGTKSAYRARVWEHRRARKEAVREGLVDQEKADSSRVS